MAGRKRKRHVLSLATKLDIIAELEKGISQRVLADKFDVAKSTVSDISHDRVKIKEYVSSAEAPESFAKKRHIMRRAHFGKLDEAVHMWFVQECSRGAPVSGPLLQEKAISLFKLLYQDKDPDDFKASSGWLHKFCVRHDIRELSLSGESLSADIDTVAPFQEQLSKLMDEEGYTRDQIFNADETGLWWKQLPSRLLCHARENQPKNHKKAKDRVTLMACANASGTFRLPLMLVNKSVKPRCFKHMDMSSLPVDYFAQNKSWVDRKIFGDWFHNKFVPRVRQFCDEKGIPFHILLLLDNAPGHPSALESSNGNVKTLFLPSNTTSIIQPMDQGILDPCKRRYKKQLLRHIIMEKDNANFSIPDVLKKINLKDAVYWAAAAWEDASCESLANGWKKLLPSPLPEDNVGESSTATVASPDDDVGGTGEEHEVDLYEMFAELGYQEGCVEWQNPEEWLQNDNDDPGWQPMTEDDIVQHVLGAELEPVQDSDSDSEEDLVPQATITHSQACEAFSKALEWMEAQPEIDPAHLMFVKR